MSIITLLMRLPLPAHPLDGIFPGIPVLLSLHCLRLLFLPCIQEVEGEAVEHRHQLDCLGWEPKATACLSTASLLMEQALLSLWVSRTQHCFAAQQTVGLGESSFPSQTLRACWGFVHSWQGQENRKAAGSVQPLISSITDNARRGRPGQVGSWLLKVPRSTGEHPRSLAQEGVIPERVRAQIQAKGHSRPWSPEHGRHTLPPSRD